MIITSFYLYPCSTLPNNGQDIFVLPGQDKRAKSEDKAAARARRDRQNKIGAALREQLGELAGRRDQRRREKELEAASVAEKIALV